MLGPRHPNCYPNGQIECQEAVAQGIADLIEEKHDIEHVGSRCSPAALAGKSAPGIRDLIGEAKVAGWQESELANAIKVETSGMAKGSAGADPNE